MRSANTRTKALSSLYLLVALIFCSSCLYEKDKGISPDQRKKNRVSKTDTIGIDSLANGDVENIGKVKPSSSLYKSPSANGKMNIDLNHPVRLTIRQYGSDPGMVHDTGGTPSEKTVFQYDLRALNHSYSSDSSLIIHDSIAGDNVILLELSNSIFDMTKVELDYGADLMNGQTYYGHDGLVSQEYVAVNLHQRSTILSQLNLQLNGVDISIPKQSYQNMLRVRLSEFRCYTIDQTAIIVMAYSGGDGAGSYTCFSFYNLDNQEYLGRYFNWCGYPETFCSEGIDFFSQQSESAFYHFYLTEKKELGSSQAKPL